MFVAYTRPVREGHKAVRSDRSFLRSAPPQLDLLVCGDSHPRTGIDARELGERVFNIAIGGEHYLKTWYRMRSLLERRDREVKALMLPLDVASFSSWHADSFTPEFVWGRYVDYLEVGRVQGDPWGAVQRLLKARVFPYAGELRTFNQLRTKRFGFGEDLPTGSILALPANERRYNALEDAKLHLQGANPVDPSLLWAFHNLLAWADERDVRVVLVGFPVTRDYARWTDRTDARARVRAEVLEPLLAEGDVTYLDHHDLFFERDDFFADSNHLNAAGRIAFSRYLRKELVALGVLEQAGSR
jgi:hypothetical protein